MGLALVHRACKDLSLYQFVFARARVFESAARIGGSILLCGAKLMIVDVSPTMAERVPIFIRRYVQPSAYNVRTRFIVICIPASCHYEGFLSIDQIKTRIDARDTRIEFDV